jgi:polyferredoxin
MVLSPADFLLWGLAASMAVVTSYTIKWTVQHMKVRGSLMVPFVIFVLVMMLSMLASAVVYFSGPSLSLLITLVVANMLVMGAGALPFVFVMFRTLLAEEDAGPEEVKVAEPMPGSGITSAIGRSSILGLVIALVLLNEFFMGWAFLLASGGSQALALTDAVAIFSTVIGSYWFLFTMSLEMALTTFFLRKELTRSYLYLVAMQSVVMFLSPTAILNATWVGFSVYAGSVVMIILYVFAFEFLARNQMVDGQVAGYLFRLMAAYGVMMAGLYLWELTSSAALFALSILLEMVIYLNLVLAGKKDTALMQWHSRPWWVLGVLSALFVGEFFMGAFLDAQVNGPQSLLLSAGLAPIAGGPLVAAGAGLYDFLAFFGSVTVSPWFLIMMGAEMGALVVFRIREVRELETRIRLVLVIVAYGVYAVFLPSFFIPDSVLPKIPFVGWSMGVGTAGAVAPALLVALVGTYVISGGLSFLFGSRQVCSMFCTAALMYQGTFYDSMKTFNRTSTIGRKFLTSRMSSIYKTVFTLVWISVISAVAISYLDSVGVLDLSVFGSDPAVFLYTFYFGFLWYIIFVTIPFVGTYACVGMGWCHWGTFNQLVSRLGFFKLKVRDSAVCVTCETRDCAKACPVGLTDLPGSFIAKGEFKSTKCIGVGDCVSACPYSNEYFFDVRHWLRGKGLGKKSSGGVHLPVISNGTQRQPRYQPSEQASSGS